MLSFNTSTTSSVLPCLFPPATTKTSGDLVLTEDVPYRLVGIGGSEGSHCCPVALVRTMLVGSPVEG